MKYSRIILPLLALGLMAACENTNEDPVKSRGEYVVPIMGAMSPAVFYTTDFSSSYVEFDVSLADGDEVDATLIEVVYNDSLSAVVQQVDELPAKVHIDAESVFSALGVVSTAVKTSDVLNVFVLTTKNDVTTRSLAADRIKFIECPFLADNAQGAYTCVSKDWEVEGNVEIRQVEGEEYTFEVVGFNENVEGLSDYGTNIILEIDPNTFNISNVGESFVLAPDLAEWDMADYTGYTYTIVSGSYDTCSGTYTVEFSITVDQGSYGSYKFEFAL